MVLNKVKAFPLNREIRKGTNGEAFGGIYTKRNSKASGGKFYTFFAMSREREHKKKQKKVVRRVKGKAREKKIDVQRISNKLMNVAGD